jgi:ankyrin repeat protein
MLNTINSFINEFRKICETDDINAILNLFETSNIDLKKVIDYSSKENMLHIAASMNAFKIVGLLLLLKGELNLDVNTPDNLGNTALYYAVKFGNNKMVKELIMQGANPNTTNIYNITPLYIACVSKKFEIINTLLKAGAKVNKTYKYKGFFTGNKGVFDNLYDMYRFAMHDVGKDKGEDYQKVCNILQNALINEREY